MTSPSKPLDERPKAADSLDREAQQARDAISHSLDQLRDSLKDAGDVRAWTRQYPWASVGVAAAAGALAALAIAPRRRGEPQPEGLVEKIVSDEQIAARIKELAEAADAKSTSASPWQSVAGMLWRTFGPALQSGIAAALAAKASQQPDVHADSGPSDNHGSPDASAPPENGHAAYGEPEATS